MALQDQIAADGDTPWCIGIESGAATGWPATDWTEDLMLRTTSLENYDKWVKGELKFDSPEVKKADRDVGRHLVQRRQWSTAAQGRSSPPSSAMRRRRCSTNPPKCWLPSQGNFITSFFPEGTVAGVDYDFFYLPPVDPQYGKPVPGRRRHLGSVQRPA